MATKVFDRRLSTLEAALAPGDDFGGPEFEELAARALERWEKRQRGEPVEPPQRRASGINVGDSESLKQILAKALKGRAAGEYVSASMGQLVPYLAGPGPHTKPRLAPDPRKPFGGRYGSLEGEVPDRLQGYGLGQKAGGGDGVDPEVV